MPKLPDYPAIDRPIRASWGRQVVDFLRSLRPNSGQGVDVDWGPQGVVVQLSHRTQAAGGGSALPTPTTLYKLLVVREYDADGALVPIGDETYPLLEEGHTLRWTEDWGRMHS